MSLLNFPRLKAELMLPSSFLVGYKVKPEKNVVLNPDKNILYSTVQSTDGKSINCTALLGGTQGTGPLPKGNFSPLTLFSEYIQARLAVQHERSILPVTVQPCSGLD